MADIKILDGAMGTELLKRGAKVSDYKSSIWSAHALLEAPEAIEKLHLDYINAGADVITANNYAVTRKLLKRENLEHQLEELTLQACRLAQQARARAARDCLIAGSLAPLDTTYRADLVGSDEDNLIAYREMAKILAPEVDMFICETMTLGREARAAATAATETGKPTWVSWTLAARGGHLRGGELPTDAIAMLSGLPIEGFLLNCAATEPVSAALPDIIAATDKPVGAYCNPVACEPEGFEPELIPQKILTPEEYLESAKGWVKSGATLIGGCCDTNPAYIELLAKTLK